MNIISKQEDDDIRIEYGKIINDSIISNGDYAINYVWGIYNIQKVPNKKRGEFLNRLISKDDRKQMIYRKSSRKLKENFS